MSIGCPIAIGLTLWLLQARGTGLLPEVKQGLYNLAPSAGKNHIACRQIIYTMVT